MNTGAEAKKKHSWQLTVILAVTLLPILAAYVAYYTGIGVPESTVNQGILLTDAKPIPELLKTASGELPSYDNNRQWRLFIPVTDPCTEACQEHLYLTRQVHIRLGEKADRVARFAINLAGDSGAQYLASIAPEHPKLQSFTVTPEDYSAWIAGSNIPADARDEHYVLLADQVGFAMMYYDSSHDGNQILKDIKRVLRYSPE